MPPTHELVGIWVDVNLTQGRLQISFNQCSSRLIENMAFLPLDEAVASRAVFVIVSGADGLTGLWGQLNNSKTVRDIPYVSVGS